MKEQESAEQRRVFCGTYLRTMDPERAAAEAGCRDGFRLLGTRRVQARLEKMRGLAARQLRREDVLLRLAQLAFGGANDATRLTLRPGETEAVALNVSAVAELKVTDKSVEIKLVDRVRALETLCGLLESGGQEAAELLRALTEPMGDGEAGEDE